jgi:hypothetical protein
MYLHLPDVFALLKGNLDYIVNAACADLRFDQLSSKGYNYRPALVVDAVFSAFGSSAFDIENTLSPTQSSFSLLKEMVLSTFDQVDQLAARCIIGNQDIRSLLRVMNVIVYRAVSPMQFIGSANSEITEGVEQVQTALLTGRGFNKMFLSTHTQKHKEPLTFEVPVDSFGTSSMQLEVEYELEKFYRELNELFPEDGIPKRNGIYLNYCFS